VAVLRSAGLAGCNLEDTDHATGDLRDPGEQAEWLRGVREAASAADFGLVINARVDVFFEPWLAGAGGESQRELVPDALRRANAYLAAGVDCVYPIVLWDPDALRSFIAGVDGAVNAVPVPGGPPLAELAAMGAARVSWGPFLFRETMACFEDRLAALRASA
jgi:2-methylisocitrate lyase-like PEP mutase family enzyme